MERPAPTVHDAPPPPAEHERSAINTFETIISRASTPILPYRPSDSDKHAATPSNPSSSPAPASSTKLALHRKAAPSSNLPNSRGVSARDAAAYDERRYRPRTFSYISLLPFPAEPQSARDEALGGILRQLYIAIKAEDFSPGAMYWSRQLQNWLSLKFEMPRTLRATLAQMFYHLALAQGLDSSISDRFVSMVIVLTRKYHYLKPGHDLTLDWRPLWREFKSQVLPYEVAPHQNGCRKPYKQLWKLCLHSHAYFDPCDRKEMLDEFLPYFSTSDLSNAYIVVGLVNAFLPTAPAPGDGPASRPEDFLPTLFHLWSLVSRSWSFDNFLIDFLGRLTRDFCKSEDAIFTEYGILTKEQSDHVFTAILRLTEIPVGQADSPYSNVDYAMDLGAFLEKDKKKYPVESLVARFIVNSLSGLCDGNKDSVLSSLEGLVQSIETFFHPSNQGGWTSILGQLTHYLVDFFVLRWNREQSGELDVPQERKLTPALKKRFVLCLRDVSFMGIFCKSSRVTHYYYAALHGLAYLEPALIIPGALQRFYPSLQGLVEVHRTTSSLNGLLLLANIISKQKGYRCHMTALLALALPGIDANDLNKTQYTLSFIQSVAYSIPMVSLIKEGEEEVHDTTLAVQWVQSEMARMEKEGQDVKLDYEAELTDQEEANILRSSTAGLGEFILTLLGKVFTLLENLPDSSHLRTGTPEENVIHALPSALAPMFASLSDELFDMALDKLCNFVSSHVVHQACDAMAWIVNALCKANPEKTLKAFVPMLIVNIRNEIDHNHAASDRSSGTDYLPRDRALVWHVVMLGMVIVHVGADMLRYKHELLEIAKYMQEKCRGLPAVHISNLVHHMLLTLTRTYPIDHALYEPEVLERGVNVGDWGRVTTPSELSIRWHRPSPAEIAFAQELFAWQTRSAVEKLDQLMSDNPPVPRKGKNKEWSDEVVRVLQQVRLVISGMATLFDPKRASGKRDEDEDADADAENDGDPLAAEMAEDEEMRPDYHYEAGYVLRPEDPVYEHLHVLREEIGHLLSRTHTFLTANQEDDVACFTALYTAYRAWITDVGVERSAHHLELHLRLYRAHIAHFKVSGLRKQYPRPLLVKRAEAYQIQRVKHNASCRPKGPLDKQLLLDLAESCLSSYAEVRRVAQSVQDSSLKSLVGGRPLVIPVVIDKFRKAIEAEDHDKIKGGLYTLLFTSLTKTISRDWRFAPEVVRLYVKTAGIDKQSIQTLGARSLVSVMETAKPLDAMILVDQSVIDAIKTDAEDDDCSELINSRHDFIVQRHERVRKLKSELGLELTRQAKEAHWKIASRCTILASSLCVRFFDIAPPEFIEFVARGVNDPHPGLRATHIVACTSVFTAIDVRATYGHDYKNLLLGQERQYLRIDVPVEKGDAEFTQKHMASFDRAEDAEYFVDSHHPGWLVWGDKFVAKRASPPLFRGYDEIESSVLKLIGGLLTKDWFKQCFGYLKQEPRDSTNDRFRMTNLFLLMHVFGLMHHGVAAVTFAEIQEMVKEVYEDGGDKHQHRATAEILAALLVGTTETPRECREKVWAFAAPLMIKVMREDLTPENLQYWLACLNVVTDGKDPRRYHELERALRAYSIDMTSNAAFKDSSKIMLLDTIIAEAGWHFRHEGPILEDMLAHLDHPYKSVRESIGRCIATIYRTRYHESFESVDALLAKNKEASSLGLRPYQATREFSETIRGVFDRLEQWRHEREPGQQTPSAYTQGSKTVLVWLDAMLSSQECTQLAPFFPEPFIQQLLHMMDVKEDPELPQLAYHVYRHIPNIPLREGEDEAVIASLIRIGRSARSWHQRLRALINLQVIYFRRLFLTKPATRDLCFEAVGDMLADQQLEVRTYASNTLAGMIRCLPRIIRDPAIDHLKARFFAELKANPMPQRRRPGLPAAGLVSSSSATATPPTTSRATSTPGTGTVTPSLPGDGTPADMQAQIVRRHAAVLGLGALIEAFPYATPPPRWMPEVLATLASRAASDPGVIGKATKAILSDFKKTRQDSWNVDQKYFTSEQLEDLEGVLWKSYFA